MGERNKWCDGITSGYIIHLLLCMAYTRLFITMGTLGFLPREAMLSVVYAVVVCLCVCVCHTPVLYQNG